VKTDSAQKLSQIPFREDVVAITTQVARISAALLISRSGPRFDGTMRVDLYSR
jgi:hypothetical protein